MLHPLFSNLQQRFQYSLRKLARNRKSPLARALDRIAVDFHEQFENWNYKLTSNGEGRVLDVLREADGIRTIIDAGANRGDWARLAANKFPQATIHAFELSPVVAAVLGERCAGESRIVANACGLSDLPGEIDFFYAKDNDLVSSAVGIAGGGPREHARGRVLRGADYCSERGIQRVDFLKIDVEGMEDKVLRGFSPLLERGEIRFIQFEYGRLNIDSHFLLKDAYRLLTGHDFLVGKIYPEGVLFKDYDYADENFLGPNYLAVRRSETTLLERLAAAP